MPTFTKNVDYSYVPVDEAVGVLSRPSGNEGRDFLHSILIDLLQRGYIRAVRSVSDDPPLRYIATEAGRAYSHSTLGLPYDNRHA